VSRDTVGRVAREFLKIGPGTRVLDIGCGTANILAHLPADVDYHGYDLNPDYVATARERYGTRGTFEVRAVSPEAVAGSQQFDVVLSIGVLHHLDDDEARTVFASAAKLLRPGGRIVTCDGAYVPGQNPIARLLLSLDRGRHVREPDDYVSLARPYFSEVNVTMVHDLLVLPYTHCIIEACNPPT